MFKVNNKDIRTQYIEVFLFPYSVKFEHIQFIVEFLLLNLSDYFPAGCWRLGPLRFVAP